MRSTSSSQAVPGSAAQAVAKRVTSIGRGGRPVRTSDNRRIRVCGSAEVAGFNRVFSSRASTNRSIGLIDQSAFWTSGTDPSRTGFRLHQSFRDASSTCQLMRAASREVGGLSRGSIAPRRIQLSKSARTASGSGPLGGILIDS